MTDVSSNAWVPCPICGEDDMRQTLVDGNKLIHCVNHACASNGGTNASALAVGPARSPTQMQRSSSPWPLTVAPAAYGVPDGKGGVTFGKGWMFSPAPHLAATEPLLTATQLQLVLSGSKIAYLQRDDIEALQRLDGLFSDGEGYDLPKETMQRLAELGAVRHVGAGRYSITAFGRLALSEDCSRLPLETPDECNRRLDAERAVRSGKVMP